jgi:hypothetical protein
MQKYHLDVVALVLAGLAMILILFRIPRKWSLLAEFLAAHMSEFPPEVFYTPYEIKNKVPFWMRFYIDDSLEYLVNRGDVESHARNGTQAVLEFRLRLDKRKVAPVSTQQFN